jgi:2-oxoisovalerate dehydrogenase E1 component alpha subunit
MTTDATKAPAKAVQGAFNPSSGPGEGTRSVHLPPQGSDFEATTLSADVQPSSRGDAGLAPDVLLDMYRTLLLARALDERMWQLNRSGKAAFIVSGQGHEGAQIGAGFALERGKDFIVPYYRDLALCLSFGLTATDVMMAALAKAPDPSSGGRQMPAHYGSARLRIITSSSPVSTQIPHAVGIAHAAKLRRTNEVALTCFGEGGSSKGDFHESCNFAGIHKLPVIFFCENNQYAISVPASEEVAIEHVADRAAGYGFPGVVVDGTDVLAVYQAVKAATDRARSGEGATLIEAKVYRFQPHTSDDDDRTYRDPEEVKAWKARDPVARFERLLRETGVLDDESANQIRTRVMRDVNEATDAADAAPYPDPSTFDRHVYAER